MHRPLATRLSLRVVAVGLMTAGATAAAAPAAPAATLAPCRIAGVAQEVRCGTLARPLDPARPQGERIVLHYAVVPAAARNKHADPVLLFAGGPGQSAIEAAGRMLPLLERLGHRRDLVFIDQRGTGRSAPLACPREDGLAPAERLDTARAIARLRDCRQRLQALPHGDARHYTTHIAMQDVEAVRAALGAPQLNLVGVSYGSRAALEYLRLYPARVRRVLLDGVAPPDMALPASLAADQQAALDALFDACEREARCHAAHPQLRSRWQSLLDAPPRPVQATDPLSGRATTLQLTAELLVAAVRGPLYLPVLASALPHAIDEAAQGRATALLGLAASLAGARDVQIYEGMHFAVVCAEDMPLLRTGRAALPATPFAIAAQPYLALCDAVLHGSVPDGFYTLPPSAVPVLALSGTLDPVTPPRHGERVVRALGARARHVAVPHAGHGVLAIGCARDVLTRFVDADRDADALAVDAGCLMGLPRPPAFEPPSATPVDAPGLPR